ncbi:UDP-3-O-(3-hydroxymyristoyl)glucosamine N-acyltransferase, partial [Alphaproteobacteria bacterium]|nr:UDP-3-O-(3-hydroxymyristoyl)glucosamine N-acyltransferase [Alphaproteobacteria bacterium]
YLEIKTLLISNNINPISDLQDNEIFTSLNSLGNANDNELTFFNDISQVKLLEITNAKACLINNNYLKYLPKSVKSILVENTYNSFALLSNLFASKTSSNGIVSDKSSIHHTAILKKNVQIDSFVDIGENCKIDNNVIIHSNCKIGSNVVIGANSIIHSNSNLQDCIMGTNCVVKSGAVIGGTGFGFDPKSKVKINHIGNVLIGDNCNIGSNTTIDRAVFDSTIISNNSFLDNLVQIAHNVCIGKDAIIAAQTGIAGSTIIGDNVIIGGQAGISGHLRIGKNVQIAAKSGVTKNIENNSIVAGFPAVDIKRWKISNIKLNKL